MNAASMAAPPARSAMRGRAVSFAVVSTAAFMFGLDTSVVNVGIPSIEASLRATPAAIQLIVAGYQLAYACTLITAARLGDMFGRRRLFLIGLLGFTCMSALCGAAPDTIVLILARVGQGMAAGMAFPQIFSTIQVLFAPEERGRIFGIYGSVTSTGQVIAPVLAGALIGWDLHGLDWRLIFFVNVPIGLFLLPVAFGRLEESRSPKSERLDLLGAAVITAALFMVICPLTEGRQLGWPWWTLALLAGSVPVFAFFARHEIARTRADASPLLYTDLFADRVFRTAVLLVVIFFSGTFCWFFTVAIYLQAGFGFSALQSGLTTFPFSIAAAVLSFASGRVARRLGSAVLRLGVGLLWLAMLALAVTVRWTGTGMTSWDLLPAISLAGVGLGLYIAPLNTIVLSGVRARHTGSASGVLSTAIQVGAATGVALAGIILFGLVGVNAPAGARAALSSATARPGGPAPSAAAAARFVTCFDHAARAPDFAAAARRCDHTVLPDEGNGAAGPSVAELALRHDFSTSFSEMLAYQLFVFTIAFGLTFALSRSLRANAAEAASRAADRSGSSAC